MARQHICFSCIGLKAILLTALVTFQLVCSSVAAQASSTRWPTTEFKVVHRKPTLETFPQFDIALDALLGGRKEADPQKEMADAAWERLIEGYLKDIATRYQEAGFEPPNLHGIMHEGKKKYVVYLFDYNKSGLNERQALGAAHNVFDWRPWRKPWIVLDRESFTHGAGRNEVHLYSTLAHEVFHALQGTYDRKYGSIAGGLKEPGRDVVVEGGASGAAMYLVSKRFPGYLEKKESSQKYLGAFPYHSRFFDAVEPPLDTDGSKFSFNAYHTSSFWFHLAERFGSLSVIEYILRRRLQGRNIEGRLRWLDGALKDHPGIQQGLYTIFPHFVTELASYGVGRYELVSPPVWEDWIFSGCDYVRLISGDELDAEVVYDDTILPMGARCVLTVWSGFPADGQLKIEAIGPDRNALDQLNLGIASGNDDTCWETLNKLDPGKQKKYTCVLEKLFVQTGPSEGQWSKTWELAPGAYGEQGRAIFGLSNVAVNPWETKEVNGVTIRFAFARTESQAKKLAPPEAEHLRTPPPPPMREMIYGIKDKKPLPGTQLPDIRIPTIEITGNEPELLESFLNLKGNRNRRNSLREYRVRPDFTKPLQYGYTGPFYGVATIHDPAASGMSMISSQLCNPERAGDPIGKVLYVGEEQLKVHVKTDLCEMKITITPPYAQAPTKVDHLDAVIVLPFGWRYFRDKAPVDIVTPGVDIFISRYHTRMQELWGPQWPFTGGPTGTGGGSGGGPGGSGGPGPGSGSGSGSAVNPGCDCSCEAFNKLMVLSKRRDGESKAKLKEMSVCAMQCTSQWTACAQSGISP